MAETIVVLGACHAGAQAVDSLRREGYKGRLVLIGDEESLPYQRPPLSKAFLGGKLERDRLLIRHAAYYDSIHCELMLGRRALKLDAEGRTLLLDDGSHVGYDRLILATGGRARPLDVPGAGLAGIHLLRTVADVDAIRAEARAGQRAVIVGAGYIGLECAATFRQLGLDVTVIEMADRVMNRVVAAEMSRFYSERHTAQGVRLLMGRQVQAFGGETRVDAVACSDGERFPADIVIVGVGLLPNSEIAEAAGLACDDGITVDEHCRSSDPDVYAIGDCCNHPSPRYGRRIRLESVDNAFEQARTAAANLCGRALVHDKVPWFWSDQYELKLQIVGLSQGFDQIVMRGDPAGNSFSCCYLRNGELIALDAVNNTRDYMAARKFIAEHGRPDPARLADPEIPLRET